MTGSAPPFSGGVAHAQIFQLLEHLDFADLGYFLDAQNAAFADRDQRLFESFLIRS